MYLLFLRDVPGLAQAGQVIEVDDENPIAWNNELPVQLLDDSDKTGEGFKALYKLNILSLIDESENMCMVRLPNGTVRWGSLSELNYDVKTVSETVKFEDLFSSELELQDDGEMTFFSEFVQKQCEEKKFKNHPMRLTPKKECKDNFNAIGFILFNVEDKMVRISGIGKFGGLWCSCHDTIKVSEVNSWLQSTRLPF